MSTQYPSAPQFTPPPVEISASTAIKLGFFAALGATLFSMVLTLIAGIIGLVIALIFGTSLLALLNR